MDGSYRRYNRGSDGQFYYSPFDRFGGNRYDQPDVRPDGPACAVSPHFVCGEMVRDGRRFSGWQGLTLVCVLGAQYFRINEAQVGLIAQTRFCTAHDVPFCFGTATLHQSCSVALLLDTALREAQAACVLWCIAFSPKYYKSNRLRESEPASAQVVLYNFGVSSWGGLPLVGGIVGALIGAATGNLWGPAGFGCWGPGALLGSVPAPECLFLAKFSRVLAF